MYYRRHGANVSDHISSSTTKVSLFAELFLLIKSRRKIMPLQSATKQSKLLLSHFEKLRLRRSDILNNIDDIIDKLSVQLSDDTDRKYRLQKTFLVRAWLSLTIYFKGGYRRYSGFRSLIKDIFFP